VNRLTKKYQLKITTVRTTTTKQETRL